MISSIYYNHHHFISNSSQLFDFILYVPLLPLSVEISGELQELCLLIRSRNTDHNEKPEKWEAGRYKQKKINNINNTMEYPPCSN